MGMQDATLKQKAKVNWFEEGDSNTKYFHSTIKDIRRRLHLNRIEDHRGQWIERDANIGKAIVHHFNNIINCIPQCINDEDNEIHQCINDIPVIEKINDIVFSISPASSGRPDGYNGNCFQTCWDIIKDDIREFVQDSGFVKETMITKNILLAQEIAQGVNKKNRGSSIDFIWGLYKESGTPSLLMGPELVLSRSLNELKDFISFTIFSMDHRSPIINHLAYADDIKLIDKYEKASGQKVNNDKSLVITAPHTCANRINRSRNAIGFMDKPLPFIYLGCPIYNRRKTSILFDVMLSKIVKKLNGWQDIMISPRGRMVLIKHVLESLPTYMLSAMSPPKGITKLIENSWNNLCLPKDEGGVDVRKMEDIIDTLRIKRWWRFRTQLSL
ncbi:hypothetical protein A4A49_52057 [Nicotiana attenuata]|uniref:Reverse transcriptase domain-containing protein n=1 Tax=Nicotiana attenuata TaxID=49451 RepID=A0A314LBP7_NICAT|nr:hypothetical protein A4A49_52057 [Nicotiana attenuata]